MSLKNTKNLVIIAAVVVAVLAGTVLLGNYTNILSASSDTDSQPKTCQTAKSATCSASQQAFFAENAEGECTQKAECGSDTKTCPSDSTKPCCAQEASKDCPSDCAKPCCAEEAETGCCPKSGDAAAKTGCCPKTDATVAAKTGCCPGTVSE